MVNKYLDASKDVSLNQKFRQKRFSFFKSLINKLSKPIRILDIGGTQNYWERMNFAHENVEITLLNLNKEPVSSSFFKSVIGDAADLREFKDQEFDVVFSNSVIEHLFTYENQKKMADEIRRVGKNYFVQTPNYYFPIEPHWLFPFFQFLPFQLKVKLTQKFDLGNYPKSITEDAAISRVNEVKLLTSKQIKALFPDGEIYNEKFLLMNKSFTMYKFK